MILCCTTCGNSFHSSNIKEQCTYCSNNTEVLLNDEEESSIPPNELQSMINILKEKYKDDKNPCYNTELWSIREHRDETVYQNRLDIEKIYNLTNHKITTGYNFDGYKIIKYNNVICGNVVIGTGFLSQLSASINDFLGTTSSTLEKKIETVKELAVKKLIMNSTECGGNAIIGIDFDFFTIGNDIIAISANGTSVVIEEE